MRDDGSHFIKNNLVTAINFTYLNAGENTGVVNCTQPPSTLFLEQQRLET